MRAEGIEGALDRQRSACHGVAAKIHLIMGHELAMHAFAFPINADIARLRLGTAIVASRNADL